MLLSTDTTSNLTQKFERIIRMFKNELAPLIDGNLALFVNRLRVSSSYCGFCAASIPKGVKTALLSVSLCKINVR